MGSRTSLIKATIEYVVCIPTLVLFIYFLRNGRRSEYIDLNRRANSDVFPLEYWRNLWSNGEFTNEPPISLKDCVKLIHNDIVTIWNQDDNRCPTISAAQRNQDLSSDRFKIHMSHVVKDLAVPAGGASAR